MDIKSEKLNELAVDLQRFYQRKGGLRLALNALVLAMGSINDELERIDLSMKMHENFLSDLGFDVKKLLAEVDLPPTDSGTDLNRRVNDIIQLLMPKKRIVGQDLLDFLAQQMVLAQKPMTITDMLECLAQNGYEQPGQNARNNLLSMMAKNKQRFERTGRGQYFPTEAEELRQLKALSDVRDE